MNYISDAVQYLASLLWGWPMVILLLVTHLFLTIRLKFPQRWIFKGIRLSVQKDKGSEGDVSQFGALVTALAATIGTGNIVGVATAISMGGPGAVLWCWLTGVLGIATKYSEGLLAVRFREKTEKGTMLGGPMYALEKGLGMKFMAILFCVFTAIAAFGIGNMVQANAISVLLNENYGWSLEIIGVVMAVMVALVILFGVKGIAKTCTALVPMMAIFYILGCFVILYMNAPYLGKTLQIIVQGAFNPSALGGGFVGTTIMVAARYGISRGLFSNESGLGSAPIVAAAAKTRNPVRQALVSATGTFWDTVVVCAITGLVLVSSIVAYPDIDYTQGGSLSSAVFSKIPVLGPLVLSIGIVSFAYTTILGWSYYGEKAIEYLIRNKSRKVHLVVINGYRMLYIVGIYVGCVASLAFVWNLADLTNALMAIPNILSLLLLSGLIAKETDRYMKKGSLDDEQDEC